MTGTILVAYGTKHGSTREVADAVAETLAELGLAVDARPAGLVDDVSPYQSVDDARAQLDRALAKVPEIEPCTTAIFGGVIDPAVLRFPFNRMPASDARDWAAIRAWTRETAVAFGYGKAASEAGDPRRELQQTHR